MPEINLNNFPPSGTELEMRTIIVGPRGPMRVILDIGANDEGDDFNIDLTVSNAAEHSELKAFLGDVIELLQVIVDESDFDSALETALEEKRAEVAAEEDYAVDTDDFYDEDIEED